MSDFTKADGAKIEIRFTEPVNAISDSTSNAAAFTVTVPEYNFVPGGEIQNVVKNLKSATNKAGVSVNIDLSNGTLNDLEFSRGVLTLGVAE